MDEIRGAGKAMSDQNSLTAGNMNLEVPVWGKTYSYMLTESWGPRNKEVRHLRKY